MGYDAYAVAVIGIRHAPGVIKSKLFQEVTQRACGHEMAEGMKHCPECGAPRTTTFPMPIPEYDADDDPKLCGYELVHRGEGYYDDPEFIAFWTSGLIGVRQVDSSQLLVGRDWSEVCVQMKAKLAPLGLWEEGNFGLHVFMYESC